MTERSRPDHHNLITASIVTFLACLVLLAPEARSQTDSLLPDIIVRENDLYDYDIVTNIDPGRTHLRLSNGTANIGEGKLYLWGDEVDPRVSKQDVYQRIYLDDDSHVDVLAGTFIYHFEHDHIHFQAWSIYRLREVLPNDGVGPIIAEGEKTSFCILDLGVYDSGLPNYNPAGEFHTCQSQIQGLSVGWVDVYSKGLPDQNIDITGVPDGIYWLESEVDPENRVIESNETNNITRIKVVVGEVGEITPDSYEPNESWSAIDSRPPGGPNSPNLGPCNPQKVLGNLSIDPDSNDDYFKFYANETGESSDYVRINFVHALGDLDMHLLDANHNIVAQSTGTSNEELISLEFRPEGWYYVRVFGYNGAVNPDYTLTIDPPSNSAPTVTMTAPPIGDVEIIHGGETYTVTWDYNDPENDDCWVTVYANTSPALDGNELMLVTSLNTEASLGQYVVNSSYLDLQTYWFYTEITDGGTTIGDWSSGTVTAIQACCLGTVGNANCSADGLITVGDIATLIDFLFITGQPLCCPAEANAGGDPGGSISVTDIGALVDHLFVTGTALPPCPEL